MPPRSGFTLVELSIVLVIIGLLVGGVLAGKALIQQAEIRAATSQLQKFETAYNTFRLKYGCIMGDCANATDFFGANYMSYACTMPNGNGNGDGNGLIDSGGGGFWYCENEQASKSLALANLLPTSLTNACISWAGVFKGINDSCAIFYRDDLNGQVTPIKVNTIAWLGYEPISGILKAAALSPVQARLIDEKIDDGKPTTGKFRGLDYFSNSGLVSNSCSTSGAYNLNEDYTCRSLYYLKQKA